MAIVDVPAGTTDLTTIAGTLTTGDVLRFMDGSQAITAGTDLSAIQLNQVIFGPNFRGSIPGTALKLRVDNGTNPRVLIQSSASILRIDAGATGGVTTIDINPNSGEVRLVDGGTFATVRARRGDVYIDAGAEATTVHNYGARLTIAANSTAITTLNAVAGETYLSRPVTTLNKSGNARVYHEGTAVVTTVNGWGGIYYHSAYSLSGGAEVTTITTYNVQSPTEVYSLDFARANTLVGTLNINAPGRVVERKGNISATFTTKNDNASAGTITEDAGFPFDG